MLRELSKHSEQQPKGSAKTGLKTSGLDSCLLVCNYLVSIVYILQHFDDKFEVLHSSERVSKKLGFVDSAPGFYCLRLHCLLLAVHMMSLLFLLHSCKWVKFWDEI